MSVTAHGASFSFTTSNGRIEFGAPVVGLSITYPTPDVVDMTPIRAAHGIKAMYPTGDTKTPGKIKVDWQVDAVNGTDDPQYLIGRIGSVVFRSTGWSIRRNVYVESASVDARNGSVVRGTISFVMTDYYL